MSPAGLDECLCASRERRMLAFIVQHTIMLRFLAQRLHLSKHLQSWSRNCSCCQGQVKGSEETDTHTPARIAPAGSRPLGTGVKRASSCAPPAQWEHTLPPSYPLCPVSKEAAKNGRSNWQRDALLPERILGWTTSPCF